MRPFAVAACALGFVLPAGCSDPDPKLKMLCPDKAIVLALADVQPAPGSSVKNKDIVHTFTVVAAPGLNKAFAFAFTLAHTAGSPVPPSITLHSAVMGGDIRYSATAFQWQNAPGQVSFGGAPYAGNDGCDYVMPAGAFSYAVVP